MSIECLHDMSSILTVCKTGVRIAVARRYGCGRAVDAIFRGL